MKLMKSQGTSNEGSIQKAKTRYKKTTEKTTLLALNVRIGTKQLKV